MTGASHKHQFFVMLSLPGKRSDRDGLCNLLLLCKIEWRAITDNVCIMVTWCFMDGNVIFAARAGPGQRGRSISICPYMCDWISSVYCLTRYPGEKWRLECSILKISWIVHLFPRILLILQIRVIRSCLIIAGCSDIFLTGTVFSLLLAQLL